MAEIQDNVAPSEGAAADADKAPSLSDKIESGKQEAKGSSTDALKKLVQLLIDATNDEQVALGTGQHKSLADYGNLLPDFFALIPEMSDLPSELEALKAEDIAALVGDAQSKLQITNDRARGIVNASLSMVSNLLLTTLRDAENVAKAIKSSQADK